MGRYREIVVAGDLIRQRPSWWLFGDWVDYRNLSEESRITKERMDNYFMAYKQAQHDFVIVQKNVQMSLDALRMSKMDNSEAQILMSQDQSIFEERDGVKYNAGKGGNSSGKGGGNNNQQNQNKGNGDNQQNNQQHNKGKRGGNMHRVSLMSLLSSAEITVPKMH